MADKEKKKGREKEREFVFRDGLCFEKQPYGLVFCPQYHPHPRKHQCPDCMQCAMCSDPRCALCRSR